MDVSIAVSVVVPTFRSPATLPLLVERIIKCGWFTHQSELVIVDDGNDDDTWLVILGLAERNTQVRGLRLGRNFGQHAALLAGVREARNRIIVTLDDDLQNPPEEVPKMLAALTNEFDVVYGLPARRRQSPWRNFASMGSKRFMRHALGFLHATDISAFRVFRTRLRQSFDGDLGPGVSLDALLNWSTTRFTSVEVEHEERQQGRSNYGFGKLVRFMLDTATGYSTVPLKFATGLGLLTIALSIGVLIYVTVRPLMTGESVPGFPFLASTIAIFSGTQLLVLGILGQYIGRMHFRVMAKPTYTISESTSRLPE
ncbi:MAG: glycosyltransferase [Actinobacteria bacterium]|nr:glycosyltransferase [Actinomycetota bacterium]NBY58281.1 glycosyltransferase [Actinomycetota bacterium]NDC91710.1 glycosyltransferase [Acidimicrobiia bacterium]NDD73053.1 glycosyltransferase [Actinomycetota bacterium]